MATPYHHALSSCQRWGGVVADYQPIHEWFDASKEHLATFQHRALRHHTQGIFECARVFGDTITNSNGRVIPVRLIGEQHVLEDMGFIPTLADWLKNIKLQKWMATKSQLDTAKLEQTIDDPDKPTLAKEFLHAV